MQPLEERFPEPYDETHRVYIREGQNRRPSLAKVYEAGKSEFGYQYRLISGLSNAVASEY